MKLVISRWQCTVVLLPLVSQTLTPPRKKESAIRYCIVSFALLRCDIKTSQLVKPTQHSCYGPKVKTSYVEKPSDSIGRHNAFGTARDLLRHRLFRLVDACTRPLHLVVDHKQWTRHKERAGRYHPRETKRGQKRATKLLRLEDHGLERVVESEVEAAVYRGCDTLERVVAIETSDSASESSSSSHRS